ncbi:MAG: phosphomannomutase/phosphoglucomutase, partial [Chromatiales bacterium]|nr:phosphomannomutase/phosphoglucomutase [Chromatiales bacterium]
NFPSSGVATVPVLDTIWQVAYVAGSVDRLDDLLLGLVIIVVAGLLLLLAAVFLNNRLKQRFHDDQVRLYKLAEGISEGRSVVAPEALTAEMQAAFNLVAQLSQVVGHKLKSGAAQQTSSAKPEPAVRPDPAAGIAIDELDEVPPEPQAQVQSPSEIPAEIFRAYDIRGIVDETLTEATVYELGRAIGSEVYEAGQQSVIVGRDGRHSSKGFSDALSRGLMASGRDVVDIGVVPTPILYFATHFLGSNSGVMVTGSHNPVNHNGLKIVVGGEALYGEGILALQDRLRSGNLLQGEGHRSEQNLVGDYIKRVVDDVQLARPLKVVIDCGNGVAGAVVPQLLREIGCEVIELFTEVDGDFPNHHPDPGQPENLADLIAMVKHQGADIGLALDGDGDRLGVIDSNGRIIWPDRVLMLLARDVLLRHPGADVLYDVKSTRHLAAEVLSYGGRPIMWKSGHSLMKAKMRETGALLAGELSGHFFFKERWYGFDDGLYSAVRLLEVLSAEVVQSAEVFMELPDAVATHELIMPIEQAEQVMQAFMGQASFPEAKIIDIDGVRAEFKDGWGLLRASNTQSALVFRFEADSKESLERIQTLFRDQLQVIAPQATPPF